MTSSISIECPSCGYSANVPDDAIGNRATCPRCKEKFIVQPLAVMPSTEPPRYKCPVCADEEWLEAAADSTLGQLDCPGCHGDFLPVSAAETLVRDGLQLDPSILPTLETFTKAEPIACPGCAETLTLLTLKGAAVDWCPGCGAIWLDRGELHNVSGGRWGAPRPKPTLRDTLDEVTRMGIDELDGIREYHVRQDSELKLSTVFFGWDHASWYDIRGPIHSVAVVAEESKGLMDALIRNFVPHYPRRLSVLNRHLSEVIFELDRPWFFLLPTITVTFPTWGRKVGRVEGVFNPLLRIYRLRDASGEIFARIHGSLWRPWTFFILGPSGGERRGVIRKKWGGVTQEYFTRGDRYTVDVGDHDWTLEQRCLLLAAAIAIDLGSFERRGADY